MVQRRAEGKDLIVARLTVWSEGILDGMLADP
jgi:hypothetical protein